VGVIFFLLALAAGLALIVPTAFYDAIMNYSDDKEVSSQYVADPSAGVIAVAPGPKSE
jgi:hypothetical protein